MKMSWLGKWKTALKVLPLALVAVVAKYGLHALGWEVISLSPLFSGLLAATFFLLGFLMSGVLTDYKESEKLPGEMAASLEAMADEAAFAHRSKRAPAARALTETLIQLAEALRAWFHGRESAESVLLRIANLNEHFAVLEPDLAPAFVARMKQEQSALRRVLIRVRTVRETSFVQTGYAIAEIAAFLLVFGLLLAKIDPFYESLFFVGMVAFVLAYLLCLIRDLDDPFEYQGGGDSDEISLKPIEDLTARLKARLETLV